MVISYSLPSNIRYATYEEGNTYGKIAFDFEGCQYLIREPHDGTILVGTNPILAGQYILRLYGFMLGLIPYTH